MKYYIFVFGLLISTRLFSQTDPLKTERIHAVIKGNIKNNKDKLWEYGITGYFNNNRGSVPIDMQGNFNKTIWFDGDVQDISLFLSNDAITIDLKKNDTIEINWDARAFASTFSVRSLDKSRNNELQAMVALHSLYWRQLIDLNSSLHTEKWNDSVKFSKINNLYNLELQTALDHKTTGNKLLTDIYFQFAKMVLSQNLLQKYDLTLTNDSVKTLPLIVNFPRYYKIEQEEAFKNSSVYREFLFDYISFNDLFRGGSALNADYSDIKISPFSPSWDDYYRGLSAFKLYQLRDWFISRIPGIFSDEQIEGWKLTTVAVHQNDTKIFLQLMHTGRIGHQANLPEGVQVVGVSAIAAAGQMHTDNAGMQDYPVPVVLSTQEVKEVIGEYVVAAKNAIAAGFDGVELHAANGYLIEQFLNPNINDRTDSYGGSIENRTRFAIEVAQQVADAIGKEKVGVRISPNSTLGDLQAYDADTTEETYIHLSREFNRIGLAYIHIGLSPQVPISTLNAIRTEFEETLIYCNTFTTEKAEAELEKGDADLIAFGRAFLANPDLNQRIINNSELNAPDFTTLYTPGAKGYTDYPVLFN